LFVLILTLLPSLLTSGAFAAPRSTDRFWDQVATQDPPGSMSLRGLFSYMLTLAELQRNPERIERLCDLVAMAQNNDPNHPHYGNLKWTWRDSGVTDTNAVEFCMQDAAVLWIKHRDWVPEPAREKLRQIMLLSIEGCLRHRVPVSYTNIAILNAANLIVLGELFDQPAVADEGYARLDDLRLWTWAYGTHEFCSPTYYGTDLGGLEFLREYSKQGRRQADALLEVFWTDIAANWFPPARKLAGAHSRSYDYLRGLGHLDLAMQAAGWIEGPGSAERIASAMATPHWPVPARLQALSERFPRLVRQSWGVKERQSRTHQVYSDVTLSTAGDSYGSQDMLLTVDLPGDRQLARCYFIPDGREDPYGKVRYPTGSALHMKALHLTPFWAAAQCGRDALATAVYRKQDLAAKEVTNVQSHFVFRRTMDGMWLGGRKIDVPQPKGKTPGSLVVEPHQALVLRSGTAAVGIRILAARAQDGQPARVTLVDDGQPDALRLTVDHRREQVSSLPLVALWVRIGTGLATDEAFDAWRKRFDAAKPDAAEIDEHKVRLAVSGDDGPVSLLAGEPFGEGGEVQLVPAPARAVLEVDGQDLGRPILNAIESPATLAARRAAIQPIAVPAEGGVAWEAERGVIFRSMTVGDDPDASGGHYVWHTGEKKFGGAQGSVNWTLQVAQAGKYYLWGRVLAPDPEHDSFHVAITGDGCRTSGSAWNLRDDPQWTWQKMCLDKSKTPTPLELSAGVCQLQLRVREAGTKIDRLFLTSDPKAKPR
jgi:hypothetical protein